MYGRVEDSDRDKRSFSVCKDGPKFRIVVTPPTHRRNIQKLVILRGYMTNRSAEEDIMRLKEHLITKKIEKMRQKQRTHRNIMEVDRESVR